MASLFNKTSKPTTRHPQVELEYQGRTIEVDEKIAPLLVQMWYVGISTNFSCQGDTELFVNQDCYQARPHRAYIQMTRDIWSYNFIQELFKEFDIFAKAEMVSFDVEFSQNPSTNEQRVTVRFPSSYIYRLIEAIERWN